MATVVEVEVEREAQEHAADAARTVASGVLYVPPGASVPPCRYPCTRCVAKGRK